MPATLATAFAAAITTSTTPFNAFANIISICKSNIVTNFTVADVLVAERLADFLADFLAERLAEHLADFLAEHLADFPFANFLTDFAFADFLADQLPHH